MQEIRYEILELMGQGTFGQVVQCRELSTNQYVAIKIIKRHNAFTAQGEKEINILKMVISIFSFFSFLIVFIAQSSFK